MLPQFDQTAIWAAKVRNVSKVGSQILKPQIGFELRKALNAVGYCGPVTVQTVRQNPRLFQ